MAREYLKSKHVKFKEHDVSENPAAAQWVLKNAGQIVTPVLDVNGRVIIGFDRPKIDEALGS